MNRVVWMLAGCLLLVTIAVAQPNYYFNTAIVKPFAPDDVQKYYLTGGDVGVGMGWNLSEKFELGASFAYEFFSLDDNTYLTDQVGNDAYASVGDGDMNVMALMADARILSPHPEKEHIVPFIVGSVGLARRFIAEKELMTADEIRMIAAEEDIVPAAGIGIGATIDLGDKTAFFVELRAMALFTDEITAYVPLKFGMSIR